MIDQKFIDSYIKVRKFCIENEIILYVHGTHKDIIGIINEGLHAIKASLKKTTFCFGLDKKDVNIGAEINKLFNYSFSGSNPIDQAKGPTKNFILLGIPSECNYFCNLSKYNNDRILAIRNTKPIWKEYSMDNYTDEFHSDEDAFTVTLPTEFIIGGIDTNKQEFIQNQNFKVTHDYVGLYFGEESHYPHSICPKQNEEDKEIDINVEPTLVDDIYTEHRLK